MTHLRTRSIAGAFVDIDALRRIFRVNFVTDVASAFETDFQVDALLSARVFSEAFIDSAADFVAEVAAIVSAVAK